jgi:hypothetical protein
MSLRPRRGGIAARLGTADAGSSLDRRNVPRPRAPDGERESPLAGDDLAPTNAPFRGADGPRDAGGGGPQSAGEPPDIPQGVAFRTRSR